VPPRPSPKAHPIGLRIKQIRTFLGRPRRAWSQSELARALEMDVRTLRRREADGRISGDDAARLAQLAHCDADWILTGKGRRPGGTIHEAPTQRPAPPYRTPPSSERPAPPPTSDPRHRRSEVGYLLRALTARDDHLRLQVSEGEAGDVHVLRFFVQQAGQVLAERVAAVIKHTFENNEIANTVAGRAFAIAFLEQIVVDFTKLGLDVSDMATYVIELRRSQGPKGEKH